MAFEVRAGIEPSPGRKSRHPRHDRITQDRTRQAPAAIIEQFDQITIGDAARRRIAAIEIDRLASCHLARTAIGACVELAVQPSFRLVGEEVERIDFGLLMAEPLERLAPDRMTGAVGKIETRDPLGKNLYPA